MNNIIIGILLLTAGMAGAVLAYILGVQAGMRLAKGDPVVHMPRVRRPVKETESERKLRVMLSNIDNYDGSGKGQVDIE